jgi:hypothetical protein
VPHPTHGARLALMLATVLALAGCASRPPSAARRPVILNRWRGYVYVAASKPTDLGFPMGVTGPTEGLFAATLFTSTPPTRVSISPAAVSSSAGGMLSVDLELPALRHSVAVSSLIVHATTAHLQAAIPLGSWRFTPVAVGGPLTVTSQYGAVEGFTIPAVVSFHVTFTLARPGDVRDLTLLLNAPTSVVTARMDSAHRSGNYLRWTGILLLHQRRTQLYLVPAVRYLFDGHPYIALLMPYFVALLPSRATAAHFGTVLSIARRAAASP